MERSAIRGPLLVSDAVYAKLLSQLRTQIPDCAALHPGYELHLLDEAEMGEGSGVFAPNPSFTDISQPVSRVL